MKQKKLLSLLLSLTLLLSLALPAFGEDVSSAVPDPAEQTEQPV